MDTLTTTAPGRTASSMVSSTAFTPAHSNATSAPVPPVSSRTRAGTSSWLGSRTWSATPLEVAFSLRAWVSSLMIVVTPRPLSNSLLAETS